MAEEQSSAVAPAAAAVVRKSRTRPELITDLAYVKIILHAMKFPESPITGLLLGPLKAGKKAGKTGGGDGRDGGPVAEFTDAIPLFHNHPLLPMTELAMELVTLYCEQEGLEIKGLYCGNARNGDVTIPPFLTGLGHKIRGRYPDARILLVDNNQFGGQWSLIIHESRSGQAWTPLGDSPVLEPSERARKNIESRLDRPEPQEAVFPVDLDEHLEDITKDWLNLDFTLD